MIVFRDGLEPPTSAFSECVPGCETFQTDINPLPRQQVEGKTDLVKSEVPASTGVAVTVASEAAVRASFRHGY